MHLISDIIKNPTRKNIHVYQKMKERKWDDNNSRKGGGA